MRRILVVIMGMITYLISSAQYYSPNFNAFEWGAELVRQQQQANQNAYNYGSAMGLVLAGQKCIAEGDYATALEKFQEAYDEYDYIPALECIGICYELGIGCQRDTDWADRLYETGASYNDYACRAAIQRINSNGHWPASFRKTFLTNFRNNFNARFGGNSYPVQGGNSDYSPSSGGSNSVYSTCRICGGSGVCTSCNGRGGEFRDTGYYTGSGSKSWISCPSCNGSKKCFNCHGSGRQ